MSAWRQARAVAQATIKPSSIARDAIATPSEQDMRGRLDEKWLPLKGGDRNGWRV